MHVALGKLHFGNTFDWKSQIPSIGQINWPLT